MDDHQAIELPPLPQWRLKDAADAYQAAQEIMNPESVQVVNAITGYFQSSEFFWLVVIVIFYRLSVLIVRKIPTIIQELSKLK